MPTAIVAAATSDDSTGKQHLAGQRARTRCAPRSTCSPAIREKLVSSESAKTAEHEEVEDAVVALEARRVGHRMEREPADQREPRVRDEVDQEVRSRCRASAATRRRS